MRRSQTTAFIILGVVLIMLFVILFISLGFNNDSEIGQILQLQSKMSPIQAYIDDCLSQVVPAGVFQLSRNGGFIYWYEDTLLTEYEKIAYHSANKSPSLDMMKDELQRFTEESMMLCILNLGNTSYRFDYSKIDLQIEIGEEKINVEFNLPVTYSNGMSEVKNEKIKKTFPFRLKHLVGIKDQIVEIVEGTEYLDLDALSRFDVEVNVIPYDRNTTVYAIVDDQSLNEQNPLTFMLAVKEK
jgi:hypothetical protein